MPGQRHRLGARWGSVPAPLRCRPQVEELGFGTLWLGGSPSVAKAREKGLYRMEGKEYVVADGDVLLFKFNV